jgi:hypothetical protein
MQVDDDEYARRLEVIGACTEVVPLRLAMMDALGLFGITQAYFLAPLTRDPRVGRIVTNWGLPWAWEKQYREKLHLIDPIPDLAIERPEPVVWPDDLAGVTFSAKQQRYLDTAAQFGLGRGVG